MAHGKAIFEHADDEGEQPLLAQFHEDMERWADNQQLSYGSWGDILNQLFDLAEAGKILPEENRVLREHVKQSQEDLERKSLELYKAQELIAELSFALKRDHHAALGLLVKQARDYCEERGILASGEIPF